MVYLKMIKFVTPTKRRLFATRSFVFFAHAMKNVCEHVECEDIDKHIFPIFWHFKIYFPDKGSIWDQKCIFELFYFSLFYLNQDLLFIWEKGLLTDFIKEIDLSFWAFASWN
jgi:hypothetical protein